jgi:hypothetical protein
MFSSIKVESQILLSLVLEQQIYSLRIKAIKKRLSKAITYLLLTCMAG